VIAASDWWRTADSIELAIVDALGWVGPMRAADLARTLEGDFGPRLVVNRLQRLVAAETVEVVETRQMRGVSVRLYRVAARKG
jgi:hypothetical protein